MDWYSTLCTPQGIIELVKQPQGMLNKANILYQHVVHELKNSHEDGKEFVQLMLTIGCIDDLYDLLIRKKMIGFNICILHNLSDGKVIQIFQNK